MTDDPDQRPIRHNGYVGPKERQCDGKSRFSTKSEAKASWKRVRTKYGKTTGGKLYAYRCVHCGYWHLGHWRPPGGGGNAK